MAASGDQDIRVDANGPGCPSQSEDFITDIACLTHSRPGTFDLTPIVTPVCGQSLYEVRNKLGFSMIKD